MAGASPLHILQHAHAVQALTHSMGSMSAADGPALPPCQPDAAIPQLQDIVARALKRSPSSLNASPGAAVLVIAGGKTIVRHCWGQESVAAGRAVTEHTVFDIASLSKQFTALAVVRLVGDGRITLSSPLSAYITDFVATPKSKATSAWSHVTVQHLLHHTSGAISRARSAAAPMHMRALTKRSSPRRPARLYGARVGQRRRIPQFDTRRSAAGKLPRRAHGQRAVA